MISISIDGIVRLQWAAPDGIFGRTTALIYHHLTVAQPYVWDICIPSEWSGTMPPGVDIPLFVLPPHLRRYGVETMYLKPLEGMGGKQRWFSRQMLLCQRSSWAE